MNSRSRKRIQRINTRNNKIVSMFESLCEKHPEWRVDALLDSVSKAFFLSPRTIQHILKNHGGEQEVVPDLFSQQEKSST